MRLCPELNQFQSVTSEVINSKIKSTRLQSSSQQNMVHYFLYNRLMDYWHNIEIVNKQLQEMKSRLQPGEHVRDSILRLDMHALHNWLTWNHWELRIPEIQSSILTRFKYPYLHEHICYITFIQYMKLYDLPHSIHPVHEVIWFVPPPTPTKYARIFILYFS